MNLTQNIVKRSALSISSTEDPEVMVNTAHFEKNNSQTESTQKEKKKPAKKTKK